MDPLGCWHFWQQQTLRTFAAVVGAMMLRLRHSVVLDQHRPTLLQQPNLLAPTARYSLNQRVSVALLITNSATSIPSSNSKLLNSLACASEMQTMSSRRITSQLEAA